MWTLALVVFLLAFVVAWVLVAAAMHIQAEAEDERQHVRDAALRALDHFDDDDPPLRREEWRRGTAPRRPRPRSPERDEFLSGASGVDFPPDDDR